MDASQESFLWGLVNSIQLGLIEFGTSSKGTVEIMKSLTL